MPREKSVCLAAQCSLAPFCSGGNSGNLSTPAMTIPVIGIRSVLCKSSCWRLAFSAVAVIELSQLLPLWGQNGLAAPAAMLNQPTRRTLYPVAPCVARVPLNSRFRRYVSTLLVIVVKPVTLLTMWFAKGQSAHPLRAVLGF
jgi:hypothetical protein